MPDYALSTADLVFNLRLKGVRASENTVRNLVRGGLVDAPLFVAGRLVWRADAVDAVAAVLSSRGDTANERAAA